MSNQHNWPRPDEQLQALMGRPGELPTPGNDRWGNAVELGGGDSYTFVNVGMDAGADYPTPMAIQLEFSTDNVVFSPTLPAEATSNFAVTLLKAVDVKAKGPFSETTILAPGEGLPFCSFITRGITVTIQNLGGEAAVPVFVHCVVAPTTMVDCASIANPNPDGYSSTTTTRLPAVAATIYHQAAQPTRAQVYIQNRSAHDLYVSFGPAVSTTPGAELATTILPGAISAVMENASYQGPITLQFAADDAAGYALLTTGTF